MTGAAQAILKHYQDIVECLESMTLNEVIAHYPPDQSLRDQLGLYLEEYGERPIVEFIDHYFLVEEKGDYRVCVKIGRGKLRGPGTLDSFFRAVLRRGEEFEVEELT